MASLAAVSAGADDHKILYDYRSMTEKLGFEINLLQYWDTQGNFHFNERSDEGGRISRSKRYERNESGVVKYTPLVIDATKHI